LYHRQPTAVFAGKNVVHATVQGLSEGVAVPDGTVKAGEAASIVTVFSRLRQTVDWGRAKLTI